MLYFCGHPVHSLLDGETRQIDSLWQLQCFDFWVREPGHLALALLYLLNPRGDAFAQGSDNAETSSAPLPVIPASDEPAVRALLDRLLTDNQADIRRIGIPGAPYNVLEDFDYSLSFLTSRALVSDRPSFGKARGASHQIVLEAPGIAFVQKILADCPMFDWYRAQCESVAQFFPLLERLDLSVMPYLAPDLSASLASATPLIPYIRARYVHFFGEIVDVIV